MKKQISMYIHIPFCNGKCYYCNFFSVLQTPDKVDEYFKYLKQEILSKKDVLKNYDVKSIYIGGGTPSAINSKYITDIMSLIYENFNVLDISENTIECNPNSVNIQKLKDYKDAKINRISFGVQSLNNKQLKTIGRLHNKKQAINSIKLANSVGFKNISADILLGLPKQKYCNVKTEIKTLSKLNVNHISAYMLILEENTKLFTMVQSGKTKLPTDEATVNIYDKMFLYLKKLGYNRYEVSNFSRQNYESNHNINYWQLGEYIGFGCSAHSYFDGKRFNNPNSFEEYYGIIKQNSLPEKFVEEITKDKKVEEIIMLGLRTAQGASITKLNNLGYDILKEKSKEIKELTYKGVISVKDNHIVVKDNYFGVLNLIILKLV